MAAGLSSPAAPPPDPRTVRGTHTREVLRNTCGWSRECSCCQTPPLPRPACLERLPIVTSKKSKPLNLTFRLLPMTQPLRVLPAFLLGHASPVLPTGTPRQPDASPGYLCLQSSLPLHASASSFLPATSRLVPSSQELVPEVQLSRRRASPGHGEALGWTQERRRAANPMRLFRPSGIILEPSGGTQS